jgi:hypothetical protein
MSPSSQHITMLNFSGIRVIIFSPAWRAKPKAAILLLITGLWWNNIGKQGQSGDGRGVIAMSSTRIPNAFFSYVTICVKFKIWFLMCGPCVTKYANKLFKLSVFCPLQLFNINGNYNCNCLKDTFKLLLRCNFIFSKKHWTIRCYAHHTKW